MYAVCLHLCVLLSLPVSKLAYLSAGFQFRRLLQQPGRKPTVKYDPCLTHKSPPPLKPVSERVGE